MGVRGRARSRGKLLSALASGVAVLGAVSLSVVGTSPASARASSTESAVELPAQGTVFATDFLGKRVIAIAPDGSVTPLMSGFASLGVAVDEAGDVFATDIEAGTVHELSSDGNETTVASGLDQPVGLAIDGAGDLYVASGTYADADGAVTEIVPGGTKVPLSFTGLESPGGIAVDQAGDVFVTDYQVGSVFELTPAGVQTTVASTVYPQSSVAVERSGILFVPTADSLLRVETDGSRSVVSIPGMTYEQFVAVDRAGTIYASTGGAVGVHRLTTDGTASALAPTEQVAALTVYDWSAQQITFTAPPQDPTVGQRYQAAASGGGSGKPVVFSADPTSQGCTVTAEGTVTLTHRSTCVIDADQAGGGDYTAAPQATQSFDVHGLAQQISITSTPTSPTVGSTYQVTGTGGDSGSPVVFSADPSGGGCSVTSDGTVTMTHARTCVIDADQEAGGDYAAAGRAVQRFAVHRAGQRVRFTSRVPGHPRVGHHYRPSATGGASDHRVTFVVHGPCSLKAGVVTFHRPGHCTVVAHQKGNADYLSGSARQVIRGITRH